MEMEDHHHHHQHHHHSQYGLTELRQLIAGGGRAGPTAPATPHLNMLASSVPTPPPPQQQMPSLSPPPPPQQSNFEAMMMMGRPISAEMIAPLGLHQYHHACASAVPTSSLGSGGGGGGGFEAETGGCSIGGDGGGTGRWPRQETLTLLEIRSRLDSKFKEANQKGPLWDEVSRIMSEEHGYQRSGKKCREKFENLYKYYKKTKEGKAGRQDGKHYRFFRQLEALYGETSNSNNNNNQVISSSVQDYNMANNLGFHNLSNASNIAIPSSAHLSQLEGYNHIMNSGHRPRNKHCDSLSLSNNSSEFESSSSDDNESSGKMRRNRARGWKAKIKEFIDSQMRKLMEKQEAWLEKLMRTLEQKENERGLREEEWRRQEAARVDREHKFWAKERAWIEARDSALMEALKNLTGKEDVLISYKAIHNASPSPELGLNPNNNADDQDGSEIHENVNANAANQGDRIAGHRNNWPEPEITRLIQLRTSMDSRFEQGVFPEEVLWEDIAAKMACLGYDRSGLMCREKWESINDFAKKSNSKKRKENDQCGYGNNSFHNNESSTSLYNHGGFSNTNCDQMNDHGTTSSPPPSNNANVGNSTTSHHHVVNHDHHSCFPFLMGEGSENLWDNYGLKINKGGQN